MASSRLSKLLLVAALVASGALAQAPTRVRGTITAVDGHMITVDEKTHVHLGEKSEIVYAQPVALSEIKPGDFLGVTSVKHADGKLIAYEVRRFPKPLNPGHRPFDGRDDQTMTNATVTGNACAADQGRAGQPDHGRSRHRAARPGRPA